MKRGSLKKVVSLATAFTMLMGTAMLTGCGSKDSASKDDSKGDYSVDSVAVQKENALTGLNIAYLGSSVTEGSKSDGVSFPEYIAKRNEGTCVKEAVDGSTMVGTDKDSYITRLEKMDKDAKFDLFVIELANEDVDAGNKVGEVVESTNKDDFDTKTIAGSLQYMITYVQETYQCPVALLTSIDNGDKKVNDVVQLGWQLKTKMTNVGMIDLWYNLDKKDKNFDAYMADDTHPTAQGYLEFYTPYIESRMVEILHDGEIEEINALPQYDPANVEALSDSPLKGKKIIFLGSSVTYGSNSNAVSFVEYMAARDGITYVKEAVSGTTLVDNGDVSYIARMKANIEPQKADLFICQLSTNDATTGQPLGEISDSKNIEDFDTTTVIGAMEYIIAYADQNYGCPVMFYTGTKYDSDQYQKMVDATLELQKKWGIGVIDMWNNLDVNIDKYDYYMANGIHPDRAGYLDWWTPFFEKSIAEYLEQQ